MINKKTFLIVVTFLVGTFSIIYELLISTTSSYFLGNSIKQFSLVIGFYMASMGLGAFVSKVIKDNLIYHFVIIELILGLIGALSVPLCYTYFLYADYAGFNIFVFSIISIIGILTGLEVPLLTRILETDFKLRDNISNILTFDYLGALLATIAFPFFLIPLVGIYKSSLGVGALNLSMGIVTFLFFKNEIKIPKFKKRILVIGSLFISAIILVALLKSNEFLDKWNKGIFKHSVIYNEQTPYQDITITKTLKDFSLYLNGAIQFSSRDEYRYHEVLVHMPMMHVRHPKKVLLLGGGEGLAVREVLKYPSVSKIDLVDIDPAMTKLSSEMALITELNNHAFESNLVRVYNQDAFIFLQEAQEIYDVIICDLPDPNTEGIAKLYSNAFYRLALNRLSKKGVLVTQATSPSLAPKCFWCIDETLRATGYNFRKQYHIDVPSFGDWGFIVASPDTRNFIYNDQINTSFLDQELIEHIQYFSKDIRVASVSPNNLDQPVLLDYYLEHWSNLNNEPK